ncbi:malic enzyme-like NAD(P)-binding protein [Thermithiobacillus plumbiphilus]|uniref:Malic enzyme-like NAD(P)-binding protein n=1 Tax=Thermithiobacillus plumbiphilus TaxID=1729899 RepID=A0ABU9D8X8_9PROT
MSEDLARAALRYHAEPRPGKLSVESSKPLESQRDLALAYTPGVAEPVRAIAADPAAAYQYTGKGNLVAVISNGTAVLGLGNVGPLAGKPVMEGKAVLFKHFAGIDVFDIEVNARDAEHFIEVVAAIAPTFGGINLEDIAAPDCFYIEQTLKARLDIPVFHDDQHGTAVIISAALQNALKLAGKSMAEARIVCLGAGAAGLASMRLLKLLGAQQITLVDKDGVLYAGRPDLNDYNRPYAVETEARSLAEVLPGADVFIGVSAANALPPELLAQMAVNPIVFALANPDPEILPATAKTLRPDVIMATGRSDFPNQVNNVLGFPFIFRGALDARARVISDQMLIAASQALAALAHEPVPASVLQAYGLDALAFGPDYFIPKPLDPRLLDMVAGAVARAAQA